jgi:hypothetical protein
MQNEIKAYGTLCNNEIKAYGTLCNNEIKAYGTLCRNEIIAYGTLCKCIKDLEDEDLTSNHKVWTLTDGTGHQGLLTNPTRTPKDLSITSSCYEKMVLQLMNPLQ